jgi:predicted site-specific integrase-resolvase
MLMTIVDLEKDSQISRHTWRVWIRQRKLSVVRLGRCVRVEESVYRDFLAKNVTDHDGQVKTTRP